MKVVNTKFTTAPSRKIIAMLVDLLPEHKELLEHECVSCVVHHASWRSKHSIGGIDIKVEPRGILNWNSGRGCRFGVRTGKDGLIDMQKLADKVRGKLEEIKELTDLDDINRAIREERESRRRANVDLVVALVEEGVIGRYELEESADGFKAKINLLDEEEIRAFASFRNRIMKRREMTPEEKMIAQGRADHGVIG